MAKRQYDIPLTGYVTVDNELGEVSVEIPLFDLAHDLKYDYEADYCDHEIAEDKALISSLMLDSPLNHTLLHVMHRIEGDK